ncbi:MAG: type IV toxin-antitoxin system AbiEi family antitoxin domain-containing protein [Actinomycetota bacterium]|nr:type IV toxin-antitoxin system AbiEi family antitoxin domain-containing protein [Actinomycetota bacterium]
MHPGVQARFATRHGLITRAEALDLDVSPLDIAHLVRTGHWVIVRRGVYAEAALWDSLDEYAGQPLLRARAAVRKMRRSWVLSHDSSAHALGMAILTPDEPFVHVTRPGFTGAWTEFGVKHHLARYQPEQVTVVDGLRVLDPARTAVDIARERGLHHGVVACDAAMRMGTPRAALMAAYEPMRSWKGVRSARAAVELADPGAQNAHESLGRMLVTELGYGRPETQFPLMTAIGPVWCDLRVGRHMIELDGRIKYLPPERGGVATRSVEDVVWDEKKRERLIRDEGLGVSRVHWEDYWGARRIEAKARLRADIEETIARFGTELPERLVRQAAEMRARWSA